MAVCLTSLYDYKTERAVTVSPASTLYGEITDASAWLVSVGLNYKF
jgi:prefoldin subunit 5